MGKINKVTEVTETTETNEATEVKTTAPDITKMLAELKTKSAVIRDLHRQGFKTADIAKLMNIRYQHVRNVLTQPLKTQTV